MCGRVGRWAAALLCKPVHHLCRCVHPPDIWCRGRLSLNHERLGKGLPSASHSIRRDSVTFTVWLVRLRLYRGASRATEKRTEVKINKERERKREFNVTVSIYVNSDSCQCSWFSLNGFQALAKGKTKKIPLR